MQLRKHIKALRPFKIINSIVITSTVSTSKFDLLYIIIVLGTSYLDPKPKYPSSTSKSRHCESLAEMLDPKPKYPSSTPNSRHCESLA